MTNDEIREAARLLESLRGLQNHVRDVDVSDVTFASSGPKLSCTIARTWKNSDGYMPHRELFRTQHQQQDDEITLVVLAIICRRRREKLNAALRRLAQLGVTP